MDAIGTNYRVEIEVLSPVHIGSGRPDLVDDLDYVRGRRIFVIDQERMFGELPPERWARAEDATPLSRLLSATEYARFTRYALSDPTGGRGVPRIVEQVKDVHGRPYIPGSSLKGAIRTALAWAILTEGNRHVESGTLGQNPRFADDPLEAELFGLDERARFPRVDPNRDLLRAVQVADSRAVAIGDALELVQVALYSLRGGSDQAELRSKGDEWRFFVEALRVGTRLETTIRVDDYLLRPEIARRLGMAGKQEWVRGWMSCCQAFSQVLIAHERDFFRRHPLPRVRAFYDDLAQQAEGVEAGRECLLQMSWGTGWLSKTVGPVLDDTTLAEIRGRYRLGRITYPVFPKSRRVVERGDAAEMPLGWVRLKLAGQYSEPSIPGFETARREEHGPVPPQALQPESRPGRLEDLRPGMVLDGTVKRIVSFGAFVDVGVGRDGLVHISQLAEGYVNDVQDVVQEGQRVRVQVLDVKLDRRQIRLSLKGVQQ